MARRPSEGPKFIRYFGPVIDALKVLGSSGRPEEVQDKIVEMLKISNEVQTELTDSGGIIITTGSFTKDARAEAVRDGVPPIELADGEKLIDLFASLKMGLKPREAYDVDYEFFEEFR